MSELIGDWGDKRAFKRRLEGQWPHQYRLIMGRVGRTALEWALNWPKKTPLMLMKHEGVWTDIDILDPYIGGPDKLDVEPRFTYDCRMSSFLQVGKRPRVRSEKAGVIELTHEVLEPCVRKFGGTKLRTLSVGSHFLLETLIGMANEPSKSYDWHRMAGFTGWAREKHPAEFLPPEKYAPYVAYAAKMGQDLSPLLPK